MKKIFFLIAGMATCLLVSAQLSPETMISKVPSITSVCGMRMAEKDAYMAQISDAEKMLNEELSERRKELKAKDKEYRQQAESNVASQYGLSQADMDKMKNTKNMSKEERERTRREMADKMMMNSGGITMGEIDQIKGDTAAQRAWAQGYSTQKMAEQSIDPEQQKKAQLQNMNMYELVSLQKKLVDSLNAAEGKYMKKFDEYAKDSSGLKFLAEIDSLRGKLYSMMGVDYGQGGEMEALFSSIKNKSLAYCTRYSPPYLDILKDYRLFVSRSIPAWNRLQSITLTITEMQTGVKIEEKRGTMALECIGRLLDRMGNIDQSYLMSPYVDISGNEN